MVDNRSGARNARPKKVAPKKAAAAKGGTTIPIDPKVRDRLRTFGIAGETYNEILTRLMDHEAELRFTAELDRVIDETKDEDWVDLEDIE